MTEKKNDLTTIQIELNCPKNNVNKFGIGQGYNYRKAEEILDSVKPLIAKYSCGLFLNDDVVERCGNPYLKSTAVFIDSKGAKTESNGYAREQADHKMMSSEQLTGSASSYARKRSLEALFLLDDVPDSDTTNKEEKSPALTAELVDQYWNGEIQTNQTGAPIITINNYTYDLGKEWVEWLKGHAKWKHRNENK